MTRPAHVKIGYQPALDGVRAVAVIAVVLYHSGVPWMSGGFLGVDGFFVVSGFLITTLLIDEFAATGRIDIRGFWMRRIRRLVPAVLLLAVAVTAWALLVEPAWGSTLGGDVVSTLSYVSNWRFIFDDRSYFEVFGTPSPLRHTWSLAIEEQWYVIWPLVMAGLFGYVRSRRDAVSLERLAMHCAVGCLVLAALSSAWMTRLAWADADLSRLYYGTDTRAQALLVGAALGFAGWGRLGSTEAVARQWTRGLAALGLTASAVVIAGLVTIVDIDKWLYTGGFLLIALAWACVVAAATNGVAGPIQAVLSTAPFVAVGRLSYGIYLWHWPVQLILSPDRVNGSLTTLTALRLVVTFVLAAASYALLENPVRLRRVAPTPRGLLMSVGVATASVAAAAAFLGTWRSGGEQQSFLSEPPPPAIALDPELEPNTNVAAEADDTSTTPDVAPPFGAPGPISIDPIRIDPISVDPSTASPVTSEAPDDVTPPTHVVVVGDSVAFVMAYYSGAVDGVTIENRGQMGCGVIPDELWLGNRRIRRAAACERWRDDWASAQPGDVVVAFIGSWEVFDPHVNGTRLAVGSDEWNTLFEAQLQSGVDAVVAAGAHLALPTVPCYDTAGMVGEIPSTERDDPARVSAVNAVMSTVAAANPTDVTLLDWAGFACPDGTPRIVATGEVLRPDGIHTGPETTAVVWEWLADQVSAIDTA